MSRQAHALDHLLGKELVSTWPFKPRRKSKAEIARMAPEDRLIYEREHPLTEAEKQAQLEAEDQAEFYEMTGEVSDEMLNMNEPPDSWGR